jgi:RNA polymerase sigma-70 factor, ECF subfamily
MIRARRISRGYDRSLDFGRLRSESVAFRLEIADFGAFYERTYDVAYRTALGIIRDPALAADATQEAYVAAYRHRDRFRGDAPSVAWLHRIVVNQALGALRRRRAAGPVSDISPLMAPDEAGGTIARLVLFDALDALPPRHRAALILRYYHDYDYATIAQILGTTSTNVGAMLTRGLDRLRVALESESGTVIRKVVFSHED